MNASLTFLLTYNQVGVLNRNGLVYLRLNVCCKFQKNKQIFNVTHYKDLQLLIV